ncbi:MAG: hypothetical protein JJ863_18400 [Deltaproteobacteria bacterium]|nr:hypothetical protein [Deltaproteobacteria bacterium]
MRPTLLVCVVAFGCATAEPGTAQSAGAEEEVAMPEDGERFLGLRLDTGGMPYVSTDFGKEGEWTLSAGIGPEEVSAREVVESTAETVRAITPAVDPIRPLVLGDTRGHQYQAHFEERGKMALASFGATDATASGRVIRVAMQSRDPETGVMVWDALVASFAGGGEGQLVQLGGLRFRVSEDEGQFTLMHPDEEMSIRLRITREPDPAAPYFEPGVGRRVVDREDTPHPLTEGAVLTRYRVERHEGTPGASDGDDDEEPEEGAILLAPLGGDRTLLVWANDPTERFDAFLASLRLE